MSAIEILRAEHMGFCGGVDRAIRMTTEALAGKRAWQEVWSVGPIIHNADVMRDLERQGLMVAGSLEDVPRGTALIVRSHGEGAAFFASARKKDCMLIDTTCPKVARIHRLAREAALRGQTVVIVGDANHPEVQGIAGQCGGKWCVAGSRADAYETVARAYENGERLYVVSQTTMHGERFAEIASVFGNARNAEIQNTICEATAERQDACRELAQKVDAMVVVGDKHSSNTRKLYEVAENYCKNTRFVENNREFSLKDFRRCNRIGVTAGASTPERVVKEVISSMGEFRSENYETNPMHEFMDEIDRSTRLPRNGDIVTGEVIQVTDNDVTVNLGCKKDGVIPKNEVALEEGQTLKGMFKEGDEVQAKVLKNDDGEGNILLSKKRVIVSEHWETINQACEDKTPLDVKVLREVNGGVIAAFNEVNGFIPLSQLSDRYVEKAEEFVGQELTVKVIRVDQKRNKVVFSHKAILNEARQKRMQEIWESLSVGDVIDGKVMRFTEYGAFVDIGGVDGLLHISEISWGKLRHPADMLGIGQEIKVKILSMNREKEKISLGYKQNQPEPWSVINEKYYVGQVISGKAVQLKDYGVFVEIEPGLDGLVHISEIAFRRVTDISEELEVGQEVKAKILEIDQGRKRISLSIRETLDRDAEEAAATAHATYADEASGAAEDADTIAEEFADATDAAPVAGDPSTELFDESKDQEFEAPDPDGVDAVPEAEARAGDPSTEAFDPDGDQELEVPDPDGVDAADGVDISPVEGVGEAAPVEEETAAAGSAGIAEESTDAEEGAAEEVDSESAEVGEPTDVAGGAEAEAGDAEEVGDVEADNSESAEAGEPTDVADDSEQA